MDLASVDDSKSDYRLFCRVGNHHIVVTLNYYVKPNKKLREPYRLLGHTSLPKAVAGHFNIRTKGFIGVDIGQTGSQYIQI